MFETTNLNISWQTDGHLLTPGATFLIDGNVASRRSFPPAIAAKAQLCGRSTPVCPETHQPQSMD